jgi:hypothetical protein
MRPTPSKKKAPKRKAKQPCRKPATVPAAPPEQPKDGAALVFGDLRAGSSLVLFDVGRRLAKVLLLGRAEPLRRTLRKKSGKGPLLTVKTIERPLDLDDQPDVFTSPGLPSIRNSAKQAIYPFTIEEEDSLFGFVKRLLSPPPEGPEYMLAEGKLMAHHAAFRAHRRAWQEANDELASRFIDSVMSRDANQVRAFAEAVASRLSMATKRRDDPTLVPPQWRRIIDIVERLTTSKREPPTRVEIRNAYDDEFEKLRMSAPELAALLKSMGLAWLPQGSKRESAQENG